MNAKESKKVATPWLENENEYETRKKYKFVMDNFQQMLEDVTRTNIMNDDTVK